MLKNNVPVLPNTLVFSPILFEFEGIVMAVSSGKLFLSAHLGNNPIDF